MDAKEYQERALKQRTKLDKEFFIRKVKARETAEFNKTQMQLKNKFKKARYQQEFDFKYKYGNNLSAAHNAIYTHAASP